MIVLFGAGTIGRVVAKELIARGKDVVQFADNDSSKWDTEVEGIFVGAPEAVQNAFPDATWIATALRTPYRSELQAKIDAMGVKSVSTWEFMVRRYAVPPINAMNELIAISADHETRDVLWDQYEFRTHFDLSAQRPMDDIKDVYFPSFIASDPNEVFIDCGAADGDTVKEVLKRWTNPKVISIEPDLDNYNAFQGKHFPPNVSLIWGAVSDFDGKMNFTATGDQTAHLGGTGSKVPVMCLDSRLRGEKPTFIKMDIEGQELEALWGARKTLRKHSPVLAICAYHTADHLWQIPLLIHAIQPDYRLYLRRYLEATWELIWYAVPPERAILTTEQKLERYS